MSKKLSNPTDKDITVVHNGNSYSVKANDSVTVPDEVAIFWRELHHFLIESEAEEVKKEEKKKDDSDEEEKSEKKAAKKSKKQK
jgi:hypothetical protein